MSEARALSDLFCAATLIVARHAEAQYETDFASDAGGSLTVAGREQARALAESVRHRRVAAIWCSDMARAVQTAEIVASALGLSVRVRAGLREFAVGRLAGEPYSPELFADVFAAWSAGNLSGGCPGAETGSDVVRRAAEELASIADLYRGETVLVVTHSGVMRLALPLLARNVPDDFAAQRTVDHAGTCEQAVDADGWVLRTWNSRALRAERPGVVTSREEWSQP